MTPYRAIIPGQQYAGVEKGDEWTFMKHALLHFLLLVQVLSCSVSLSAEPPAITHTNEPARMPFNVNGFVRLYEAKHNVSIGIEEILPGGINTVLGYMELPNTFREETNVSVFCDYMACA